MTRPLPEPVVTAHELNDFLAAAFPHSPRSYHVSELTPTGARLSIETDDTASRPGGTVSGPVLMGLADGAAWLATLSRIGIEPMAVTSSLLMNFLARPPLGRLVAEAEVLRLGRRQSVTDVRISSGEDGTLVAQATVTYAIPAERTTT